MKRTVARDSKLTLTARIDGLPRVPFRKPVSWAQARLDVSESLEGQLTLWKDGLGSRAEVSDAIAELTQSAERFALAMSWRFATPVKAIVIWIDTPEFELPGTVSVRSGIAFGDQAVAIDGPPPPAPVQFPQVPLEARRLILTMAEASLFDGFVEERLRRHFLVIEELWEDFKDQFGPEDHEWHEKLTKVRNFVSHPRCRSAFGLVSPDLPSAVLPGLVKAVQFERTIEHRNFIAKFETQSQRIAVQLIKRKFPQIP
ncbi:MAG TPA: hypothetical protein VFQ84_07535 [Arenimonas sp.]|uniref:hypothetical protein n=1 Tax=Arenimonas sp. TaxID=1872635 RepID=UPI002D7F314E|nr:hypothetical protein [Arenimonas sp.]HEU0153179.1 hypothetical protein [Arenimonas sp.]